MPPKPGQPRSLKGKVRSFETAPERQHRRSKQLIDVLRADGSQAFRSHEGTAGWASKGLERRRLDWTGLE